MNHDPSAEPHGAPQRRPLSEIAELILATDATPEAIDERLNALELRRPELRDLVDHLNLRSETIALGENPAAMRELSEITCLLAEKIDYEEGIARGLMYNGFSHWFTSDFDQSLRQLLEAKRHYSALGDQEGRMKTLTFEGCVYRSLGDYDRSYLDLTSCVDYFRRRGDTHWEAITALSLAITCEQIGDYKATASYNRRTLRIANAPELRWMVGRAHNGIGNAYFRAGRLNKALEYYEKSLAACRESGHRVSEARSLNDIGMVWQRLGDVDKARSHYRESLKIRKEVGQREAQCTCLFNLGQLAIETGEREKALSYFREALDIATEMGAKPRIAQAHKHLSGVLELAGDTAGALRHHKLFHKTNEEVADEQSTTRIKNLTTRLELDKAEKLAEVERQKNMKLSEKNDELRRLLEELKAAQAHLVQSEKMAALGKLVAGVAHEINSPVGASTSSTDISRRCVTGLAELVASVDSLDELKRGGRMGNLLECLATNNDVVSQANARISRIVNSLKSFARLDEAAYQTVNIHDGLDATITLLEADGATGVRIERQYGNVPPVTCYPGELNQVFLNLLTNSVEAVQRKNHDGEIVIRTMKDNGQLKVEIRDDGVGIPERRLKTLFDPGLSDATGHRVKAGLGLFVSHNIIRKHRGDITVASKVNEGTIVTLTLPLKPDAKPTGAQHPREP